MSNTGTQFSSGNWEADTMAYMKSVEELPYSRVQEIILRAEPFMRRPRHKVRTSSEASGSDAPIAPANPRSRIRICTVNSLFSSLLAIDFHLTEPLLASAMVQCWLEARIVLASMPHSFFAIYYY